MFKKVSLGVLFGILLLLPATSHGQSTETDPPKVYLGPHFGIQKTPDVEGVDYLVGATLRVKPLTFLSVEGDIGYWQEDFGSGAVTVKSWPITVSGLLYPVPMLYAGMGAGWYHSTFDFSDSINQAGVDDETAEEFGWHLMGGLELQASRSIIVFGEARYVLLNYDFEDVPGAALDGVDADFYSFNFGLLFGF